MKHRFWLVPTLILCAFLRLHAQEQPTIHVKITQKHLMALCLNQKPVKEGTRSWDLPLKEHSMAFTMKNEPRVGNSKPGVDPGVALIHFTLVSGHQYEIEVRGPSESYSTRVWRKTEWKPVVRDRTSGLIVSSDPEWVDTDCRK